MLRQDQYQYITINNTYTLAQGFETKIAELRNELRTALTAASDGAVCRSTH